MLDALLVDLAGKNKNKKVIYPDIDDPRVFSAISELIKTWEFPVICGKSHEIEKYGDMVAMWLECHEVPDDMENEIFAAMKLASGEVDGFVGGNISTTSDIVKALIKNVGSLPGISRISSHFLLWRWDEMLLYSDAGIQIDPSAEQIAEIGLVTIKCAVNYNMQPRVAMLSFSTAGSGWDHHKALKMREATKLLQEKLKSTEHADIPVEWEIQFDAAYIPEIGAQKNPDSKLTLPANVFIFPDLDSANIAYKITQRLGWFTALWPIIQWLARPGNDLSRWCSIEDIIATHHITKNS